MTASPSLSPELNWVGQRVKLFASGSVYIVRTISLDGKRAYIALAADPKIIDTAALADLIIPEPEPDDEGDEYASPLEN